MTEIIEWLEEDNTRLRLLAGLSVVVIWTVFSLALLIAWICDADLSKGGILDLFGVIALSFTGLLGVHMFTKPAKKDN